uniref:Putative secreted peptide n=1 Tax=Anopheles braziliensis TaxID=58242 RepID=A0A2M3ZMT9_9DIPT
MTATTVPFNFFLSLSLQTQASCDSIDSKLLKKYSLSRPTFAGRGVVWGVVNICLVRMMMLMPSFVVALTGRRTQALSRSYTVKSAPCN